MGAQRDLVHVAEHVELREGDARRTLHLHAVARRHEVDGADAAGTAGLCAELRTGLAQLCRFIAEPLAGEGPLAHAGGVSLDHAHDLVELCGGQTRADRRIGGDGVGGGGVGIDAVVQIAQRAELCLEENALAVCLRLAQERRGVGDKGLDLCAEVVDPRRQLVHGIALCTVDAGEREVLPLEQIGQMRLEVLGVEQLARQHGLFLILVGVERRDALLGGAVLLVLEPRFLQRVEFAMPRQQQGGALADLQVLRRDRHACGAQGLDLVIQVLAVERHAVAENVYHALAEDAAGQQVQGELALIVHDGVARVAAALIAHDHVEAVGEIVDHAALALVAPVDAYDRTIRHDNSLLNISSVL